MIERYDAYVVLLQQPDLPCLPKRGRKYTQPGHVNADGIRMRLERAYLTHRLQDAGHDQGEILSVRRWPLHIMQQRRA